MINFFIDYLNKICIYEKNIFCFDVTIGNGSLWFLPGLILLNTNMWLFGVLIFRLVLDTLN